jgi:hypothetical protein
MLAQTLETFGKHPESPRDSREVGVDLQMPGKLRRCRRDIRRSQRDSLEVGVDLRMPEKTLEMLAKHLEKSA